MAFHQIPKKNLITPLQMEALAFYSSLGFPSFPPSPSLFNPPPKLSTVLSLPIPHHPSSSNKSLSRNQPLRLALAVTKERSCRRTSLGCSSDDTPSSSSSSSEIWRLDPVGDGDSRHIGYKVPLPGALEIVSDAVTVGRVPEKADMVIPVATVSGLHARLEKKEGNLLVTDLDSTNGTFIDEKRLRPGAVVAVPPGSCITFGDIHLAMFRVSRFEAPAESPSTEAEESGTKLDANVPNDNLETVS